MPDNRTEHTPEAVEAVARAICGWTPNVKSWSGICDNPDDGERLRAFYHDQARAALKAMQTTNTVSPSDMIELLTKAVGDITAELIMGGKKDKIAKWTRPYVEAINTFYGGEPAGGNTHIPGDSA